MKYKLIVEEPNYDLEHIFEQENRDAPKKLKSKGYAIMLNDINMNGRRYLEEDTIPAITKYISEKDALMKGRCVGELNHSTRPDVDMDRICAKFTSLSRDTKNPNYYIGESEILDTPSGRTLRHITEAGITWGYSTKMVGMLQESDKGSIVKNPSLITIDCVFQPSIGEFSQGILENKDFIIGNDNRTFEAFTQLEKHLAKYPSHHRDAINRHILEGFQRLLQQI